MYEVISGSRTLDGHEFETFKRDVISGNVLTVEAGTTGFTGEEDNDSCRAYFSIKDKEGSNIRIKTYQGANGNRTGFEVELAGNDELSTTILALKFIVKVLEDQVLEVVD